MHGMEVLLLYRRKMPFSCSAFCAHVYECILLLVDRATARITCVIACVASLRAAWSFCSCTTMVRAPCAGACRYVTIAGAVAQFYWTKGEREAMPRLPVLLALKNTIMYASPVWATLTWCLLSDMVSNSRPTLELSA